MSQDKGVPASPSGLRPFGTKRLSPKGESQVGAAETPK